jgi:hypothetical protein
VIQIRLVGFLCKAEDADSDRRVVAKIDWHNGDLFRTIGIIMTNFMRTAEKVVKV